MVNKKKKVRLVFRLLHPLFALICLGGMIVSNTIGDTTLPALYFLMFMLNVGLSAYFWFLCKRK